MVSAPGMSTRRPWRVPRPPPARSPPARSPRGYAQTLDARTINALAFILAERYAALVSETQASVVTAWREMAACHAAACAALEHELGERHGLGVSDFEVLERLAESEGRQFRAPDLRQALHLRQSALSRLVDPLAPHGLV